VHIRGPLIFLSHHQPLVQFLIDLLVTNLLVIQETHLNVCIVAMTVLLAFLISGHFDVLHFDLISAL
jgi:hypothetical protein